MFVIAGNGELKRFVASHPKLLSEIRKRIVRVLDVGYGGAAGLRQAVNMSKDVLKEFRAEGERKLLQKLFTRIQRDDMRYALGRDAFEALESGAVETLLVSEDSGYKTVVCAVREEGAEKRSYEHVRDKAQLEKTLGRLEEDEKKVRVVEVVDFVDWALDHASEYGATVEVMTLGGSDIHLQFRKGFDGIAALTKYEFQAAAAENDGLGPLEGTSDDSDSDTDSDSDGETVNVFG